ncbi:MAG: glycosyltransferase family 4 protein [Candidatus Eremiobacteraeota bacterium]|nr:glycosyltransferase family 4 protein [Candidatus Eremiobacteraeota bacterium]
MRILFLTDYSTLVGGAETGTLILRDGLRELGHEARILSTTPIPGTGPSFADYQCFGTVGRGRTLLQTLNPSAYLTLKRALSDFRPDIVHVRMFLTQLSPLILPLLKEVPSVLHVVWCRAVCPIATKILPSGEPCMVRWGLPCWTNGCLPMRDFLPLMLQMHLWERWSGAFDRVIANSFAIRKDLQEHGFGEVDVVWNGVPVLEQREPLREPATIAFAGRLVRQKGCDVLLNAFSQMENSDSRLIVAGDGPERSNLEELAKAEGIRDRVTFTGHLSRDDLEGVLQEAWVQVVPSRSSEGFGYVAAEAFMRGTMVVGSACGGLEEVLRSSPSGLVVAPGDALELSRVLNPLLRDRESTDRTGLSGREFALERLTREHFVSEVLSVYNSIAMR